MSLPHPRPSTPDWTFAVKAGHNVAHVLPRDNDVALCGRPVPDPVALRASTTLLCVACHDLVTARLTRQVAQA